MQESLVRDSFLSSSKAALVSCSESFCAVFGSGTVDLWVAVDAWGLSLKWHSSAAIVCYRSFGLRAHFHFWCWLISTQNILTPVVVFADCKATVGCRNTRINATGTSTVRDCDHFNGSNVKSDKDKPILRETMTVLPVMCVWVCAAPYLVSAVLREDLLEVNQRLHYCWGALHVGIIYHDVTCLCV